MPTSSPRTPSSDSSPQHARNGKPWCPQHLSRNTPPGETVNVEIEYILELRRDIEVDVYDSYQHRTEVW